MRGAFIVRQTLGQVLRTMMVPVCFIAVGCSVPAEDQPPTTRSSSVNSVPVKETAGHLHLVSADAAGFVHVRLADLWGSPALADFRQMLSKASPRAWAVLERKYAPAPSTIHSLTVVFPSLDSFAGSWAPGRCRCGDAAVLREHQQGVRPRPADAGPGPKHRLKKHKGQEYFSNEKDASAPSILSTATLTS